MVDAIRDYAAGTESPRLMIHAHGGLVGEHALCLRQDMYRWWLDHGVYPVFFVWEIVVCSRSSASSSSGRRDIFDFTSDLVIEGIVKAPGTAAWAGMKESARLASAARYGRRLCSAARGCSRASSSATAQDLGKPPFRCTPVAHSAGAIFHSHFIPALLAEGVSDDRAPLSPRAGRTHRTIQGQAGSTVDDRQD